MPCTQNGAAVPQSASLKHASQRSNVVSQNGVAPEQSVLERQPTHAPLEASQVCASGGHIAALHVAWQVWSAGKQTGIGPEQSAFDAQSTHAPSMQWCCAAGQSPSLVHAAQPYAGTHVLSVGHPPGPHVPPAPPG